MDRNVRSPPAESLANRLEFSSPGRHLLVGVRKRHLLVFDLALLATPPPSLTADDLLLLAEINAGTALLPGGAIEPLATTEWLDRWQTFRRRHPDFHPLTAPR